MEGIEKGPLQKQDHETWLVPHALQIQALRGKRLTDKQTDNISSRPITNVW